MGQGFFGVGLVVLNGGTGLVRNPQGYTSARRGTAIFQRS